MNIYAVRLRDNGQTDIGSGNSIHTDRYKSLNTFLRYSNPLKMGENGVYAIFSYTDFFNNGTFRFIGYHYSYENFHAKHEVAMKHCELLQAKSDFAY